MLAGEDLPLYNRVALPRFLKGQVKRERVLMRTAEQHRERGIELRLKTRAVQLDVEARTVLTDQGDRLSYDALLIASGGTPSAAPFPGPGEAFYPFQTLADTEALIAEGQPGRRAVVVGGSFIAYELADGMRHRKMDVTWIMRGPRFLRRILDEEGGEMVDLLARDAGVEVVHGDNLGGVEAANGHFAVASEAGRSWDATMVPYGLGLRMYWEYLEGTPVERRRGVVTDERMRTNVPGVFAGGDIAEFFDLIIHRHNQMGTWDNSEGHGRVAALNMLGGEVAYTDVPTYTTTMFGSTMAVFGITPEEEPNLEAVMRVDFPGRQYRKLFFLENRLVGGILIGSPKGRKRYIEIVRDRLPLPADLRSLLDPAQLQ
jgi:3-phenylpropionate/trans-cinnamate dioxygenase ferredoxin reductase subunit